MNPGSRPQSLQGDRLCFGAVTSLAALIFLSSCAQSGPDILGREAPRGTIATEEVYPVINQVPRGEVEQISKQELQNMKGDLADARRFSKDSAGPAGESYQARLRRLRQLSAQHGRQTVNQIEN